METPSPRLRASRMHLTAWPYPRRGPASTTMPTALMALVSVDACTSLLHCREPVFEDGRQLILENIADRNPEPILLSSDQLLDRVLECRRLLNAFGFVGI